MQAFTASYRNPKPDRAQTLTSPRPESETDLVLTPSCLPRFLQERVQASAAAVFQSALRKVSTPGVKMKCSGRGSESDACKPFVAALDSMPALSLSLRKSTVVLG